MNISPEDFADAVCISLLNGLPAQLAVQQNRYAAIDSANGWDIPLVPPAPEDYYPGGVGVVTKYPTVEVAAPDLIVANFDIAQHDADATFTLIVRHWQQHPIFNTLYRQMSRTSAAIVSTLLARGALSDATVSGVRGAWRINPETELRDEVVSGAVLAFTIDTVLQRA